MRILFAGPSLHGSTLVQPGCALAQPVTALDAAGIALRPPAAQGDIQAAVLDGASVIGLVDGLFETVAAVWHKEILFALSEGVAVLGAASLGALRAAECQPFGMVAIGEIARRYATGELDDDAAVAQLHAPAELGFLPVSEALVDCEPALDALVASGLLDAGEAADLLSHARALFFKERTWPAILRSSGLSGPRVREALGVLKARRTSLKRADALLLVEAMAALPAERSSARPDWHLNRTPAWCRSMEVTRAADRASDAPGNPFVTSA